MGERLSVVTPLHVRARRDYLARMTDDKVDAMTVARAYGEAFWDGPRRYGYGGYRYDGRWRSVAEALAARYGLGHGSRVLDVGCGKGFLLHEFRTIVPGCTVAGFDVSTYALAHATPEVRPFLCHADAGEPFPFGDDTFDLAVSLGTLHNLPVERLATAFGELRRVARHQYVMVESYRNERELFNLQCWALTCESFFRPSSWQWLFKTFGYDGDYEFIFFE